MRLLLIRHGETVWNAERRWQGWSDIPLSEVGAAQARQATAALATILDGTMVAAVYTSDLSRAAQTAATLAESLKLAAIAEQGLRERHVGDWAGLTVADIEQKWPGSLDLWRANQLHAPPGGETSDELTARVLEAILRFAKAHPGATVIGVTHGGVIRAVESHAGAESRGTHNLGGRWFTVDGDTIAAGEAVRLVEGRVG
jgi:probable phosphoglycerate mutase